LRARLRGHVLGAFRALREHLRAGGRPCGGSAAEGDKGDTLSPLISR